MFTLHTVQDKKVQNTIKKKKKAKGLFGTYVSKLIFIIVKQKSQAPFKKDV